MAPVLGRAVPDGLSSTTEPASSLGPSGFDPSRIKLTVGRETLGWPQLRAGFAAMRPGLGIDYFENYDVAKALLPMAKRRNLNATYIADRLLQRARKAGYIAHRGRGQWICCDSDAGSAEDAGTAAEPRSGSSADPEGVSP